MGLGEPCPSHCCYKITAAVLIVMCNLYVFGQLVGLTLKVMVQNDEVLYGSYPTIYCFRP
jgi:hypothetical protein